jgi:anti-anti-sigma factor
MELQPRLLIRNAGDVSIVRCYSNYMQFDDQELTTMGTNLTSLVKLGFTRILLNLQGVQFASGALVASLASLHRETRRAGGYLRLLSLEPIVRDALRICHLDTEIDVYASEAEALASRLDKVTEPTSPPHGLRQS